MAEHTQDPEARCGASAGCPSAAGDTTQLLIDWRGGDRTALERLMPRVYDLLRQQASQYLRAEREGHTLQTRDLVHEAYLRLIDAERVDWRSRAHFLGIAAITMRRILIDHARRRGYAKRGGGADRVSLDDTPELAARRVPEIVAVDEALAELAALDPQLAKLVELRYFGGLTAGETAQVLGMSAATVGRRWRVAKAWLYERLSAEEAR